MPTRPQINLTGKSSFVVYENFLVAWYSRRKRQPKVRQRLIQTRHLLLSNHLIFKEMDRNISNFSSRGREERTEGDNTNNSESSDLPTSLYQEIYDYGEGTANEDVENYRPGGLYPVDLMDKIDGRFEVLSKLGCGGIATVWLCYEEEKKRWRALKINAALSSPDDCPEIKMAQLVAKQGVTTEELAKKHIVMAPEEDHFWLDGPNGRHLCTVLPVLGPTLSEWREVSLGTDATRINNTCYQLAEGLDFLHGQGICHGDFRPGNVLMKLKGNGLDDIGPDEFMNLVERPITRQVLTLDGERGQYAPECITDPLEWAQLKRFVSDDVAIVDFGEAFTSDSPPKSLGIPAVYAAPEVTYGAMALSPGVDIWSFACTIMEFRTGKRLDANLNSPLRQMERFAGPIPAPFRVPAAKALYEEEKKGFEKDGEEGALAPKPFSRDLVTGALSLGKLTAVGNLESPIDALKCWLGDELYQLVFPPHTGEDGLDGPGDYVRYYISDDEVALIADLLSKMFMYQPGERMRAGEIMKHAWFKKGFRVQPILVDSDGKKQAAPAGNPHPSAPTPAFQAPATRLVPPAEPSRTRPLKFLRRLITDSIKPYSGTLAPLAFALVLGVGYALASCLVSPWALCQKLQLTKIILMRDGTGI